MGRRIKKNKSQIPMRPIKLIRYLELKSRKCIISNREIKRDDTLVKHVQLSLFYFIILSLKRLAKLRIINIFGFENLEV